MRATADTTLSVPVPWDKLLLWVQRQMALEMKTGQPASLTKSQLEALSQFVPFHDEEPEVGDQDYVSLLMQKIQARRLAAPKFVDLEPVDLPIDGHFEPRWRCTCTLGTYGAFPREGCGFAAGQQAPVFQSKKNAKQFAAKNALAFLSQSLGTMTNSAPMSPLILPPAQPPFKKSRPVKAQATSSPSPSPSPSPLSSPSPQIPAAKPSIFEQVSALTSRLGLGSPMYRVEPDPAGGNLFCGRPVFKSGGRVPLDLGVVSGVEGQKETKQQMAEILLLWLQKELQKRQDVYQSLWARSGSSSPRPAS